MLMSKKCLRTVLGGSVPRSSNCENKGHADLRGVLGKKLERGWTGCSSFVLSIIVCKDMYRHTAPSWSPTAECKSLRRDLHDAGTRDESISDGGEEVSEAADS